MEASVRNLPRRLGRYEIVGRLAFGGMAEILLGRLTGPSGFERPVVIKRILPHLAGEPSFVDMFLDEGRLAAQIRHKNVVQVQELCREDGELFLVMEYLEGEAASGLLRRARVRAKPIDPTLVAHVIAQAAAGLHAAHELHDADGKPLDIVHRDVSPENIFLGYGGSVKVLDFGIAKARSRITKTDAGMLKGKIAYMSPEQAHGSPLDRRSDVFSLGIVLYELSTGRRLFKRGSQVSTLRAITDDDIAPPSAVVPGYPRVLEHVCTKALARDRGARYATAQDMRRALLEAARELDGPAMPEEALSELMHELFADRISNKDEMLARMRDGVTPTHVPEADVDLSVEIPTVEAELASEVRTRPHRPSAREATRTRRSSRVALPLALTAVAALGVAAGVAVVGFGSPSSEPSAPAPSPSPPVLAAEVTIGVDSDPQGAHVVVGGELHGTTPLELRLARSNDPISVRLEHDGFEVLEQAVRPDVDQRLRLTLTALRPAVEEPSAEVRAEPPRRRRRRVDNTSAMAKSVPVETPQSPAEPPPEPETEPGREFRRFN